MEKKSTTRQALNTLSTDSEKLKYILKNLIAEDNLTQFNKELDAILDHRKKFPYGTAEPVAILKKGKTQLTDEDIVELCISCLNKQNENDRLDFEPLFALIRHSVIYRDNPLKLHKEILIQLAKDDQIQSDFLVYNFEKMIFIYQVLRNTDINKAINKQEKKKGYTEVHEGAAGFTVIVGCLTLIAAGIIIPLILTGGFSPALLFFLFFGGIGAITTIAGLGTTIVSRMLMASVNYTTPEQFRLEKIHEATGVYDDYDNNKTVVSLEEIKQETDTFLVVRTNKKMDSLREEDNDIKEPNLTKEESVDKISNSTASPPFKPPNL